MKLNTTAWATEKWSVHPETPHAIVIPGLGIYGGLPEDVARAIVAAINSQQKIGKAVRDLIAEQGFTPHLEGF